LDARQAQFDAHFESPQLLALHQAAHVRLLDVERIFSLAKDRREYKLFELAFGLLGDGLCQVACSNYRLAFFCLRSFLELSSAAVRFSAFEFELREWELGRRDILWGVLCGEDAPTAVYSKTFASAFFPLLAEETKHYAGLAQRTYRVCSQYVHVNPSSHTTGGLEPDRTRLWFELAEAATVCVFFVFLIRYHSELGARIAGDSDCRAILQSELGHFAGITEALESGVVA
jgi:hypothetical protein